MTPLPESLLEAVAAAAVREGLADAVFTRLRTPIGRLLVVQGPHGVVRVGFEEEPEDRVLAEVAARARARASSPPTASWRARATRSPPTSRARATRSTCRSTSRWSPRRSGTCVLETLHDAVPRGEVVTYGALADARRQPAGRTAPRRRRARATRSRSSSPATACCPSGGGIGNYGGGPERKRALLELEGACPPTTAR